MNVDAWLSGEEGTRVVEAVKNALYEEPAIGCPKCNGIGSDENAHFWCHECNGKGWVVDPDQDAVAWEVAETDAITALRAALSLTTTEWCKVCGGVGYRTPTLGVRDSWDGPCDCKGGTVPGESVLVVREQLEQRVGEDTTVIEGDDGLLYSQGETGPLKPLFTLRPLEKEDET